MFRHMKYPKTYNYVIVDYRIQYRNVWFGLAASGQ